MREIKFRVWDNVDYMSTPFTLKDLQLKKVQFTSKCKVMQSTGLKDKKRKTIYEGDIIETKFYPAWVERISWKGKPDAICEVYWDYTGFGLKARGDEDFRYPGLYEINLDHTKIIGNIYETPTLLNTQP